jgi:catechol 2,3-dioxygenase-like lactoylglutathione lyase family enzyme
MTVQGFNHLNIRTPEFGRTISFFTEALGMSLSVVPGLTSTERAAWILDANGTALFHVARADVAYSQGEVLPDPPLRNSGAIHHVALTCTDLGDMRERLRRLSIKARENSPAPGVRQLFVIDPSGITFELNFREV